LPHDDLPWLAPRLGVASGGKCSFVESWQRTDALSDDATSCDSVNRSHEWRGVRAAGDYPEENSRPLRRGRRIGPAPPQRRRGMEASARLKNG
jgi:hypothetical protein